MGWLILLLLLLLLIIILLAYVFFGNNNNWPSEPITMLTPYVNEADIDSINEAYSESGACPWNDAHNGIDFFPPLNSLREFQAVCDGVVQDVSLFDNNNNWQVNISIKYNNSFTVGYAFEPMSSELSDRQIQQDNILVATGDTVTSGQVIGCLHAATNAAHVHFHLKENEQFICPEPYFTPDAHASIMTLLQNTYGPGVQMCYP